MLQGDAVWLQVEGAGGGIYEGVTTAINGAECDVSVQLPVKAIPSLIDSDPP